MLLWLKSKTAKDRWRVIRLVWIGRKGEGMASVFETDIYLSNRYSRKLRRVTWDGEWKLSDFPGNIFRG